MPLHHPHRYCNLRLMEIEDLEQVLKIERRSYDFPWTEGNFKDCLKSGYYCLVVIEDHIIVGFGIMLLAAQEGHVLNICIAPELRGNGFSRVLLEDLIGVCRRTETQEIYLEVRPSNGVAIRLYESLGFNEIGLRPNYYNAGSGREDALIYVKSLC